jgi:pseudaminic acid synthase
VSSQRTVTIAGREVSARTPPLVVAELSANHNGDLDRALAIVDATAAAGAHAIKLQTYTADTLTIDHDGPGFRIDGGPWDGRTLYDLYQEASTPWVWHEALFARGRAHGLIVFSSPFDETAVEYLETLGAPAYKIASFEAIDLPLIKCAAQTGKPLIISTGMANIEEIGEALEAARSAGSEETVLLHCVSSYPAPADQYNLRTLADMADRFDVAVGLSDHTLGNSTAVAAVALGAVMVEKHFTMSRKDGGPDAAFSLEPAELAQLTKATESAWSALGSVSYLRTPAEQGNAVFRRSLYIVEDVPAGGLLTRRNVRSIRPGYGMPPKELPAVIGCKASRNLHRGEPLHPDMVSPHPGDT